MIGNLGGEAFIAFPYLALPDTSIAVIYRTNLIWIVNNLLNACDYFFLVAGNLIFEEHV